MTRRKRQMPEEEAGQITPSDFLSPNQLELWPPKKEPEQLILPLPLPPLERRRMRMPWTQKEAHSKTHKANTPRKSKVWAKVANQALGKTGDDARAIKEANAVVARIGKGRK
jgi:hypothetical protein